MEAPYSRLLIMLELVTALSIMSLCPSGGVALWLVGQKTHKNPPLTPAMYQDMRYLLQWCKTRLQCHVSPVRTQPRVPNSCLRRQYTFIQFPLFPAAAENLFSPNHCREIFIYKIALVWMFSFSPEKRFGNSRDTLKICIIIFMTYFIIKHL